MASQDQMIYIVETDPFECGRLMARLIAMNLAAHPLSRAEANETMTKADAPSCAIVNLWPSGSRNLHVRELAPYDRMPVIGIGDDIDVPQAVEAMRAGVFDVLPRACSDDALFVTVTAALACDREQRVVRSGLAQLRGRYATLTPREMEVLDLVVAGLLNKQSAWILGIREVTLQAHRCKIMEKMKAASLADLVRMADRLRLPPWSPSDAAVHLVRSRLSA
ncbi:response regulator transcription factor [Luteibacter sp. UNCMF366Tsu5.1]|uniref:response regulator transcription factor n=1 Tax=Luteibacter sp. UNCMF366Tsu5.1 TaxID=1502758 RepID=UPI000908FC9B|nr:LuxR C-terminal-related transcriptional regulator [Luteibacter sp. UNCMF366Tsu5.1]SFW29617.1 Two-component response regulator, FixJ family, consists of REC and HTH domains [Luteibacter sp. UNCMF366Tsu5.1]